LKGTIGKKKRDTFVSRNGVEFHYKPDFSGQVTIYVRGIITDIPGDALLEFCQTVYGIKLEQRKSE